LASGPIDCGAGSPEPGYDICWFGSKIWWAAVNVSTVRPGGEPAT